MPRFRRRFVVAVVAIASLAGLVFAAWRLHAPVVRVVSVRRSDLQQHIVVSGRVRVPTRAQLSARSPGLVVAVLANEGRRVSAGDLLVQLDDAEAQAASAQARAAMNQSRARVDQLRRVGRVTALEALSQADTNLDEAQALFERTQRLVGKGAAPAVELENARRALERARAQRASAMAQQLASTPMGTDSRIALAALLEAQARVAGAEARLAESRILAPGNGVVLSRSVEAGDVVQPGQTLIVLAVDADPELVFDADERNIPFIALGQRASAAADAYPQELFESRVDFVAPSVDPQRGTIEVRLAVAKPAPAFLKPDMTVSVDLIVASKSRALIAPSEAVQGASTRSPSVMIVERGRARRRAVTLGIRGEGATEIAAGVDEGAEVVLSDVRPIADGQRVRTVVQEP